MSGDAPNGHGNGQPAKNGGAAPDPDAAWLKLLHYVLEVRARECVSAAPALPHLEPPHSLPPLRLSARPPRNSSAAQEHRGKINFFLVLPLSFLYDLVWGVRNRCHEAFCTAPHLHGERVADVQRQVRRARRGPARAPQPSAHRAALLAAARSGAGARVAGAQGRRRARGQDVHRPQALPRHGPGDAHLQGRVPQDQDLLALRHPQGALARLVAPPCNAGMRRRHAARRRLCTSPLQVDEDAMTVTCEPLVNMGHLTRVLLPRG